MAKTTHNYLLCEAPICANYETDNLVWYPDEPVCGSRPFTKWQAVQKRIQRLAKVNPTTNETCYTAERLKSIKLVRKGVKGMNPNRRKTALVAVKTTVREGISNNVTMISNNETFEGVAAIM